MLYCRVQQNANATQQLKKKNVFLYEILQNLSLKKCKFQNNFTIRKFRKKKPKQKRSMQNDLRNKIKKIIKINKKVTISRDIFFFPEHFSILIVLLIVCETIILKYLFK